MTKQELKAAIKILEDSETVTNGKTNYSEIERKINTLVDAYCAANNDATKVQAAIDANNAANSEVHYFGD